MNELLKKVARYAKASGLKHFLLIPVEEREVAGKKGYDITLHVEQLTIKTALMAAIQAVHGVVSMEENNPNTTPGEVKVLERFKSDLNTAVKECDKALIAAQKKAGKLK